MKRIMIAWMLIAAIILSIVPCAFAEQDWECDMDAVAVAAVNGENYCTVQEAVNAANGALVTLLADSDEEVTADKDLYLDLNGKTLAKLTMTAGTLYGLDCTTDKYNNADGYGKIVTVVGDYASHHKTNATGAIRRYMAIKETDGVSFHRFYLGITHLNLVPAESGFGYKAQFYGDSKVQAQIASIGYNLWLTENIVVRRSGDFKNQMTLRLKNFDVKNYGEAAVHANVQITLTDGTVIESSEAAYSMRQIVELVDAGFANYDTTKQAALKAMYAEHEATMSNWELANIAG